MLRHVDLQLSADTKVISGQTTTAGLSTGPSVETIPSILTSSAAPPPPHAASHLFDSPFCRLDEDPPSFVLLFKVSFFPFQGFILGFGGCCICKKKKKGKTQRNCICNLESTTVLIYCEVGGSCSLRLMLSTEVPSQIKHLQKQSNLFLTRRLSELVSLSAAALSVCQLL